MKRIWHNLFEKKSLKFKWTVGASSAIFFTFFLFSLLQYTIVGKIMINQEYVSVSQALDELVILTKQHGIEMKQSDIDNNERIFNQFIEKDQSIILFNNQAKALYITDSENDLLKNVQRFEFTFSPRKPVIKLERVNNRKVYVGVAPVHLSNSDGYVAVIHPLNSYHRLMRSLLVIMLIFGVIVLALSSFFGFIMALRFLKPLKKLSNTMKSISKKGFHERVEPNHSEDEMGDITNVFNEMMDKLEASFNQQKQFVEDASHELRTPVQIIEGHLKLLNRWGKNDKDILDESLHASIQELDRMKNLVQELLDLSRADDMNKKAIIEERANVNKTTKSVVRNLELVYENFHFRVKNKTNDLIVKIGENHLEQILIIILDNAIKYSAEKNQVDVSIQKSGNFAQILIRDYGVGIPKDDLKKIFLRFYRVDKARSREKGGNGLGLSIAKKIIEEAGGKITAKSKVNEGTTIICSIPLDNK